MTDFFVKAVRANERANPSKGPATPVLSYQQLYKIILAPRDDSTFIARTSAGGGEEDFDESRKYYDDEVPPLTTAERDTDAEIYEDWARGRIADALAEEEAELVTRMDVVEEGGDGEGDAKERGDAAAADWTLASSLATGFGRRGWKADMDTRIRSVLSLKRVSFFYLFVYLTFSMGGDCLFYFYAKASTLMLTRTGSILLRREKSHCKRCQRVSLRSACSRAAMTTRILRGAKLRKR